MDDQAQYNELAQVASAIASANRRLVRLRTLLHEFRTKPFADPTHVSTVRERLSAVENHLAALTSKIGSIQRADPLEVGPRA